MIPKNVETQMWSALDEISDEAGELELDKYVLKYEGWSPMCFPTKLPENFWANYAARQSPKIHKEWNTQMLQRGYKSVLHGHDEHLGLYGVTYALYKKERL